jgi:hypothetical protein
LRGKTKEGQVARTAKDDFSDMPGQDSFLDVLTNMVGIIILLVVVTGLRTSQAVMKSAEKEAQAVPKVKELKDSLRDAQMAALAAKKDTDSLIEQAVAVHGETSLREQERDYLTTYVAAFDQELKDRRAELSTDQQRDFDLRRKLVESQSVLEDLSREQVALLAQPTEVEAIENKPTPLARRATGREVMLHLEAGHLAIIPEDWASETINDIKENIWRLKNQDHMIRTVGPMNGFRVRYCVALLAVNTAGPDDRAFAGAPYQRPPLLRPEVIWFEFIPESSPLGEPVAKAIEPNSELQQVLHDHPPDTSTVVIAVYPDSIRELHELKHELYAAGYATAELPCEAGRPLRGSPYAPRSGEIFAQ